MSATEALEMRLLASARDVMRHAHAPYSRYRVGAAVADTEGRIFAGCNVENASYGLTICAERVALGAAVAAGARHFTALAVTAAEGAAPLPCGACRQVMAEFMDGDARVFVAGPEGGVTCFLLDELLPHRFRFET